MSNENYLKKELYDLIQSDDSIFNFIQSSSLDGIWYWDIQNPEEEWMSSKFWTTLGYDPNLMPHKASAWQDIINKDDLAKAYELVQKHCEDPSFPYEQIIRYTHKNGSTVWIKCRGIAIRDENGVPVRMLGAHHDITDIKNVEFELQTSKAEIEQNEKRYRDLLFHLDAGIIVHSPDTSILNCNHKASELLGLCEEQLKGKKSIDPRWKFFDSQNQTMVLEQFPVNLILSTREPLKDYVVGVYRPETNDKAWLQVNGFPVFDKNKQQIEEVVISFIDFTAKKLAEEQLIIEKEKAEEGDRLKTAFLQNMSHEIRTPLNAILGFSKMLTNSTLTAENKTAFASIIQNSTNQLLGIVNDILTISSIETNQETIKIEEVNLNEMLAELLAIFKAQSILSNVSFQLKINDKNYHLKTDRTKLVQVITNLLSNAKKFTHEGTITFGYEVKQKNIEFFVRDTGIGIKSEDYEKIFHRFIQGDSSTTKKYGGSGLGLSISKGFIELMGGNIWLESEIGKGTTFYFTVPIN